MQSKSIYFNFDKENLYKYNMPSGIFTAALWWGTNYGINNV